MRLIFNRRDKSEKDKGVPIIFMTHPHLIN